MKAKAILAMLALSASTWIIIAQQNGVPGPGAPDLPPHPIWPSLRQLPPFFRALDANHDGVIEAEEIANAPAALRTLLKEGKTSLTLEDLLGSEPMLASHDDSAGANTRPVPIVGAVQQSPERPTGLRVESGTNQ